MYDCRIGAAGGYIVSIRRFDFYCRVVMFIGVQTIRTSKIFTIRYKKSNQWSSIYYKI